MTWDVVEKPNFLSVVEALSLKKDEVDIMP